MRARIVVQLGAFDNQPSGDKWSDCMRLMDDKSKVKLLQKIQREFMMLDFKESKTLKMADGTVHLQEYEAIKDGI